ncbi:zinc-dependent metalloprotease [Kordiimonas gwangyangensis]|uniref:zinc-dependent metalloprotease n=1 Tax=Kordiimonas gwangyangensis TaxID=288022 RepID=UPI00037E0F06|nr:zinc-dependent metalloprotease [Kordiimonas gwangyangensis]
MNELNKRIQALLAGVALSAMTIAVPVYAQDEKPAKPAQATQDEEAAPDEAKAEEDKASDEDKSDKKKKKKEKTIADLVEGKTAMDGLFKLYQDPEKGDLMMEVRADQLGKEFIYFSHTADGVVEGGHFRGQYRQQKVFKIEKHFDQIEFVEVNPYFYFDPDNAISRAADANISNSSISVHKIAAKSEDGNSYLIKADDLFTDETFDQVKPSGDPRQKPWESFNLGKLSSSKTKIDEIHNYPENTAVVVDYVYSNPSPQNYGNWFDITDARNVTVKVQHTFVAMPENDFKPRFDDARVGYFLDYVNDMTSRDAAPWRDMINRWHLVKKDPSAKVSEPVEPIVWWIENTTPTELRPTIKKAVEAWNIAFEEAGFKNAVVVKEQPDDADWDAGDIRYNVLRWTSSPQPPFGGYGPSFTNPRTGQILGADIMLEYTFLTNRMNASKVFESAALGLEAQKAADKETASFMERLRAHERNCNMAGHLQLNNLVGKTLSSVLSVGPQASEKLVEESIYYLMLHEVGHTLGLNHNMKATQARAYKEAYDISKQGNGLAGSVMDYPSINFAPPGEKQAHYYTVRPGDYDIWAIQFGYDPELDDPVKREAHLARSTEKALAFGNDADDMRTAGKGIDPSVNIYDMTDDAVQFAEDRLKLEQEALGKLRQKFAANGDSYQELRNAYLILTADMAWQGRVASRYIGGIYVDRAVQGQGGAKAPYRPVPEDKQRQAMKLLRDYIFAPDAFAADASLLQSLAIQRRGFFHFAGTEDPKVHGRAAAIQADILNHLLHPVTMMRITDSALYGNSYTLTEMMGDLTAAIFQDDSRGTVNSFRQELQVMYVNALIKILNGTDHDYIAQSNAYANLKELRGDMARWRGDAATRAHRDHIAYLIDKALEVNKG